MAAEEMNEDILTVKKADGELMLHTVNGFFALQKIIHFL